MEWINIKTEQPPKDSEYLDILEIVLQKKWEFSDRHTQLLNYIIEDNKKENIYLYQSYKEDFDFYINSGFSLYKDYGQFFLPGLDLTRYVLKMNI